MVSAQQAYVMLGNQNLWEIAKSCHEMLASAEIPHSICGGMAVCLHGYQRNTVDLDLIIRAENSESIKELFEQIGLQWHAGAKEFRTNEGVAVQFLIAGERAGHGQQARLPDPSDHATVEMIEGLPVLRLSKLIEVKLACGSGNIRRTHKDFADVVELIAIRNLNSSFAKYLHASLRKTFRELVKRVG